MISYTDISIRVKVSESVCQVDIATSVLTLYLPIAFITTVTLTGVMWTTRVPRWAGGRRVGLSLLFVISS